MADSEGVAKEIEYKFLLSGMPEIHKLADRCSSYTIHHGWLPGKVIKERISKISRSGGELWRAIKAGKGLERIEAQEQINQKLFDVFWPLTEGKRVYKLRYVVDDPTGVWEIDSFSDRTLFLAELEVPSVDTKIKIPKWLKPYIKKDITMDSKYKNVNLAM